jgi:hypothetical protein
MNNRTHKEALAYLLERLEKHHMLNNEIAEAIEFRDDYSLALEAGGDEADISEWTAICRKALKENP